MTAHDTPSQGQNNPGRTEEVQRIPAERVRVENVFSGELLTLAWIQLTVKLAQQLASELAG